MILVVVCSFLISWLMLASVGAWAVVEEVEHGSKILDLAEMYING